jgi:lipoyl(octanoyl) transferase
MCETYTIATERVPGLTGVWTRSQELKPQSKIAAIGIHISRGVTSHGFALNVNTDLDFFNLIIPCGITSKPVTSMKKELGRNLSIHEVATVAARTFAEVFRKEVVRVESLEALNYRIGVPMKPPAELQRLRKEEETFWA